MRTVAVRKKSGTVNHPTNPLAEKAVKKLVDVVVVCLHIRGGTRVSVDVAVDYHDASNRVCTMNCHNACIKGRGH